jgi:GT2 family glycosyltransferase
MLSIITAIYNQLPVNRLFLEHLRRYTRLPFELIIVDNHSEDGSGDFFRGAGVQVIANDGNYSYPRCQNQGIARAQYDLLAFLNNDVIVSPGWDQRLVEVMAHHGLEVATTCGIERLEGRKRTRSCRRKWSLVRGAFGWLGNRERALRWMHRAMYGNWERFARKRWERFGCAVREGFVGSTVMMRRGALDKIGLWDERIQAADFDLYLRTKRRSLEHGDLRPVHLALGVFNHHYIQITLRSRPPEFKDRAGLISLEEKWAGSEAGEWLKALDAEIKAA